MSHNHHDLLDAAFEAAKAHAIDHFAKSNKSPREIRLLFDENDEDPTDHHCQNVEVRPGVFVRICHKN